MTTTCCKPLVWDTEGWPSEVNFLLAILEGVEGAWDEQRQSPRYGYRVRATIEINADSATSCVGSVPIYTRDANARGIGFVSAVELPRGSAKLHLPSTIDPSRSIPCTIIRCRQYFDGWYEGAALFSEVQPTFEPAE